jgi:hypothetical protein
LPLASDAGSCLGYRFAIEEFKAMTFILLRAFTFAPPVPEVELHRFSMFAQSPKIKGRLHDGDRLPLVVAPYIPTPPTA